MLGVWFAAAHQPWMSLDFIMLQLSLRRDIQQGLRDEIGDASTLDYTRLSNLPLLDSFIKEVARLHPLDTGENMNHPKHAHISNAMQWEFEEKL
jgi:hypothetical protein